MTDMPVEGNRARLRIAADVGGTFTDIATFDVTTGVLGLGKALTTLPMTADLRSRTGNRKFDGQVYCEFAVAVVNGAMGCISQSLERGSISWSVGL